MKIITHSPQETIAAAEKLGSLLKAGDMIAYKGGLGAGKTTFTRGLAIGMGLGDSVTSPTFALVNEYRGEHITLYHFDMYRITSAEDLETTGFFDFMNEDSVIAAEWSENIEDELPEDTIFIELRRVSDDVREIIITGDDRFEAIGN